MEKYSAFRDPGTGIQPFLTPVAPNAPTVVVNLVLLPLGMLVGIARLGLLSLVALLYFLLVEVVLGVLRPVPPLYRFLSRASTAFLARLALLLVGVWWIPVTNITRKRGRGAPAREHWAPKAGDLIVSNWQSWIEVLWLAFRFDPIFVIPVAAAVSAPSSHTATPISSTPGRRTGTGSAAIASTAARPPATRSPILGFRTISLLGMLRLTGHVPPFGEDAEHARTLESIRAGASRPIVVFPECTTSNGRAMLRFAEVFGSSTIPVKGYKVFVMCVRYDPPTQYVPTLTCSIPSPSIFNPIGHIFEVARSLSLSVSRSLSIRLLNPVESPSSGSFLASDVLGEGGHKDELAEACSVLIAQLGKMRVTGQAWEDKVAFLEFYRRKTGK